jgi:hypothetical protein
MPVQTRRPVDVGNFELAFKFEKPRARAVFLGMRLATGSGRLATVHEHWQMRCKFASIRVGPAPYGHGHSRAA